MLLTNVIDSCFKNQTKWNFYHTAHLCLENHCCFAQNCMTYSGKWSRETTQHGRGSTTRNTAKLFFGHSRNISTFTYLHLCILLATSSYKKAPFVRRENWDNCSWSCHSADIAGSELCPTFGTTTVGYHTTTRMTCGMCQKTLLGIKTQRLRVFQFGLLQETSANSIVHVIATSWCGSTYSTKRYWKLLSSSINKLFCKSNQMMVTRDPNNTKLNTVTCL